MKRILSDKLAKHLADMTSTSPDDWFFVSKARFGMELVFKVIAGTKGKGNILTQSFTCVIAINPILTAGLTPEYIDVSPEHLSIDTTKLPLDTNARALVLQHSFGILGNASEARQFVDKHDDMLLIEDSAHSLGLMARDGTGEPLADVSIHSFGVEKMFNTKFGAAIWINPKLDQSLRRTLRKAFIDLPYPTDQVTWRMKTYRVANRILSHLPAGFTSLAIKLNLFEVAVHPVELEGKNHGKPTQTPDWAMEKIISEFQNYPKNIGNRSAIAEIYREELGDIMEIPSRLNETKAPVRYPLFCKSGRQARKLFQHLTNQGYYVGKWYRPTLFPGVKNPQAYNYSKESCPIAEDLSARIINLPTNVTPETAKEITNVIRSQIIQ